MSHPARIEARLRMLIEQAISTEKKWKELEKLTGIASTSWVDFNRGKKRATADMIEAVSVVWPQYAFWLATGISDPQHGHVAPGGYGFPKGGEEQPSSTRYFREALAARAAAESALIKWLDARFEDPELAAAVASSDDLLRGTHQMHAVTAELSDSLKRADFADKLRQAEIALFGNMPFLDLDEVEGGLKPLRRLLAELMKSYEKHGMVAEMQRLKSRVDEIDEQTMRHRRIMERIAKARQG
ncbi:hypothetical protein PXJ20_00490 [Paraburkholderia sp. A1RI_3L]|uniref:hypothetical protein n=1 Tax=Paraburkholderia TaxID=1822464 RepID=UPI003B801D6C